MTVFAKEASVATIVWRGAERLCGCTGASFDKKHPVIIYDGGPSRERGCPICRQPKCLPENDDSADIVARLALCDRHDRLVYYDAGLGAECPCPVCEHEKSKSG